MFQMKLQDNLDLSRNAISYPIKDWFCHQTNDIGLLIVLILNLVQKILQFMHGSQFNIIVILAHLQSCRDWLILNSAIGWVQYS